jgi:hypothetical protein
MKCSHLSAFFVPFSWTQGPRDAPGIIPRALADLFAHLSAARARGASVDAASASAAAAQGLPPPPGPSFRCRVTLSYCELYNEELIDLLAAEQPIGGLIVRDAAHDRGSGIVTVEGLREVVVADVAAAAACLAEGEARRHVAATAMNRASSRSHALLRVTLDAAVMDPDAPPNAKEDERIARRRSALSLVDLAGSERASTRGSTNGNLWAEGCAINMGLLSLGRVVRALAAAGGDVASAGHVPFRDSKLTRILAGALGGNARAAAVCCATPAAAHAADTRGTLRFAERCMLIAQRAVLNEHLGARAQLAQAQKEVSKLKAHVATLTAQLQAERRRGALGASGLNAGSQRHGGGGGGGGGGAGPAEMGLLEALEAEVERLRVAATSAEDAAAAERHLRLDAQRRVGELQARLMASGPPPSPYAAASPREPPPAAAALAVPPPPMAPASPSSSYYNADADAVASASSAQRAALARQLAAAAAAAEAQRAAHAAAGGAVNALYRTLAAQGEELRAVRADLQRAASPRPGPAPSPLALASYEAAAYDDGAAAAAAAALPRRAAAATSPGAREFWAAALGDGWDAQAPGGAGREDDVASVADSLASPRSPRAWRAAVAAAGAPEETDEDAAAQAYYY